MMDVVAVRVAVTVVVLLKVTLAVGEPVNVRVTDLVPEVLGCVTEAVKDTVPLTDGEAVGLGVPPFSYLHVQSQSAQY